MTTAKADTKIALIEYLRGIASLCVAWLHLTNTGGGITQTLGAWGYIGVPVFFVISGFVLPMSLWAKHDKSYGTQEFWLFIIRRMIRIEPPYLFSVLLFVALLYVSASVPGFRGSPPDVSFGQLLAHVAYMPPVTGYKWLNLVYWTLAYEFCFYLVVGATFLFWLRRPLLTLCTVSLICLIVKAVIVGHFDGFILLFTIGGATFLKKQLWISARMFMVIVLLSGLAIALSTHEPASQSVAFTGVVTAILLSLLGNLKFRGAPHRILTFLGLISYSLYITHVPIGGRIVNFGSRFVSGDAETVGLSILALTVSVGFAFAFYLLIERRFVTLSKGVRGLPRQKARGTSPGIAGAE